MKTLFDTSVLVAALVKAHPAHARSLAALKNVLTEKQDFLVSTHSLAELYSVLTTLPVTPKITPGIARRLIRENIEAHASLVPLTTSDYQTVLNESAESGLDGGVVFDALISSAARKAKAKALITLNPDDFLRVWPDGADLIREP